MFEILNLVRLRLYRVRNEMKNCISHHDFGYCRFSPAFRPTCSFEYLLDESLSK